MLPDCPYCHKIHWHGAVPIDGGDELKSGPQGTRRPHCIEDENKCKMIIYNIGQVKYGQMIISKIAPNSKIKQKSKSCIKVMIENKLFSDKELDKIRWQFALLLGPYCGAYKTDGRGICRHKAGYGTKTPGHGRCRKHGGNSTGPLDKRRMIMNKLTKLDKRSKLSTEIFNEKELNVYEETVQFIKENYDITDELAISQIARLFIYQTFLLDKLHQGYNVSIENSSKLMKEWLNEYGLTPRSKTAINLDGLHPGFLASIIIDVHDKMEAKRLQEEQEGNNGQ